MHFTLNGLIIRIGLSHIYYQSTLSVKLLKWVRLEPLTYSNMIPGESKYSRVRPELDGDLSRIRATRCGMHLPCRSWSWSYTRASIEKCFRQQNLRLYDAPNPNPFGAFHKGGIYFFDIGTPRARLVIAWELRNVASIKKFQGTLPSQRRPMELNE